jgi:4'-phosphopantetheinyl transferase
MLIDKLHQEAHVWFSRPESVQDNEVLQDLTATLSNEELDKYRRLHFPADRHRYLVSHALVRKTLSRYIDRPPADWSFSHGEHGRPEIANPGTPPLRFNLTHTVGLVGCIVTRNDDCGIDAEKITTRHATSGIAERMFSETEYRELRRLEGQESLEYFFTRWTLRESYVKALGIGISFPTRKLTFSVNRENSVEISLHPELEDQRINWQFQLFKPTAEHIVATAIRRNSEMDKRIVTRFITL